MPLNSQSGPPARLKHSKFIGKGRHTGGGKTDKVNDIATASPSAPRTLVTINGLKRGEEERTPKYVGRSKSDDQHETGTGVGDIVRKGV